MPQFVQMKWLWQSLKETMAEQIQKYQISTEKMHKRF